MMTTTDVNRISPIVRPETVALAATESDRVRQLLMSLSDEDWAKPTDCPLWDVRALAAHVLGAMEAFASFREFAHQMRLGRRAAAGGEFIDGMTAVQVRDRSELSRAGLLRRMAVAGPRAANWRAKRHLMRLIPVEHTVNGVKERWQAGYLFDIILTRDTWMHRVDIARASGQPMVLTPQHDGRLVAEVVAEWARRHGKPFSLTLEGPAGGHFVVGRNGHSLTLDPVEFCRILSGRASGVGLLATEVPF